MGTDKEESQIVPSSPRQMRRDPTPDENIVETFGKVVMNLGEDFIQAMREREDKALERTKIREAVRAEDRKHESSLAKIEDGQHERREVTLRWLAPWGIVGVLSVVAYAIYMGKVAESASAFAVLAMIGGFLKMLIQPKKRRPPSPAEDEDDDHD